ncbi:MAG: DUF5752 family protein [archaeon]
MIDAEKFLTDVRYDWSFWFTDGTIARNIYELVNTIEVLEDKDFCYHVNEDHQKNDFARWIDEVLGNSKLANDLWSEMDKHKYVRKIRRRVKQIEKQLDKKTQQKSL